MEIQRDYIYNIYIDVKTYKEDEQRPTFAHPLSEVLEQRASLRTKKTLVLQGALRLLWAIC